MVFEPFERIVHVLYPQNNRYRAVLDLSGFWGMKVDPEDEGVGARWAEGFDADAVVGVPGSWNEQLSELGLMNYVGTVWYQTRFHVPRQLAGQRIHLRVGSADSHAQVWVNGALVGEHTGGFLPFEFDIGASIGDDENVLVIRVNNELSHDTIPQGCTDEDYAVFGNERMRTYPRTIYDFFPYGGLNRPVKVLALPAAHLSGITVDTQLEEFRGTVKFCARFSGADDNCRAVARLSFGPHEAGHVTLDVRGGIAEGEIEVVDCKPWSPEAPHLYQLSIELMDVHRTVDEYRLDVGIREVEVRGNNLLLNGEPVFLKGFGKHEDFPVLGKGLCFPLIVKDFQIMKWIGANSFRTSHYPYAEELMQMADKMGFLVIDETPAVSLNFRNVTPTTLENHKKALSELVARDYNHPSVICWSVASESGLWQEAESKTDKAEAYWDEIFALARELDPTRPLTAPACLQAGNDDPSFARCDIICLNRYYGWYEYPGDIEEAGRILKEELETFHALYEKPILLSECGADAVVGEHSSTPQLFTEEYQLWLIEKSFDVVESLPFMIGEHVWNLAEFRTAQNYTRVVHNRKGVFDRQRAPKASAFMIRDRWTSLRTPENLRRNSQEPLVSIELSTN